MNAARRMRSIASLAALEERSAARVMAEWRRVLARERRKLEELSAYRDEYAMRARGGGVLSGRSLHEQRAFVARLNQAIAEQARRVAEVEREYRVAVSAWERRRSRTLGLEKVAEGHEARARAAESRREQAESDALALRLAQRDSAA